MKIYEVIYVREPELPLFRQTLRLEKVEKTIQAKTIKSLRRKILAQKPDDFVILGYKQVKSLTT